MTGPESPNNSGVRVSSWKCLKCGASLEEYSRPHMPPEKEHRVRLKILGTWANYEDMPRSLRAGAQEVCWGTVVDTPKYNRPV